MTIKDLAAKTGYGVATISRVLNGQPNVSEKARRIILEAAKECNFEINPNARQLKQQHSTTIAVVVKGTYNQLFGELVENIQSLITQTDYTLYVDYMDEDGNEVLEALRLCREKKPLGMLILGGNKRNFKKDFHSITVPCVLVSNDARDLGFANLSSVSTDDREAAFHAMEALIDLGHKRIVMIGGDREKSDTSRLRYEGCLQAMKKHNIPFDEKLDYQGTRYSWQAGYDAAAKLIVSGRRFTALFAAADVMAIGAIRAMRDSGLRVPEDVSVMGFDGLELGAFLVPQLSTVAQSAKRMALRSVEILIRSIESETPACHEAAPYTICLKESTSRPKG
ncbi:MAG: LacI family DNA-binding transcriptional regulator [Oscillospiraceae bacterium]|nr:LacI family DNA-binding transcriptional regulator [Oscillospiraceae bacterium]